MSATNLNPQAAFLDAVKSRSIATAVDILKGIHDGKEAVRRAAGALDEGSVDDTSRRPLKVTSLLPRLDDLRRAGDLFFDLARLQVRTLDALIDMRGRHMGRLEDRVGDLLGFPVRGNRGEVLSLTVPVKAVEADRKERPEDGALTSHCEVVRQFRAKNRTREAWPEPERDADTAPTQTYVVEPVKMRWSQHPGVEGSRLNVSVLRERVRVPPEGVLPLRLRISWLPRDLDHMNPSAEASGEYVLRAGNGEVGKVIRVVLRFDLDG